MAIVATQRNEIKNEVAAFMAEMATPIDPYDIVVNVLPKKYHYALAFLTENQKEEIRTCMRQNKEKLIRMLQRI